MSQRREQAHALAGDLIDVHATKRQRQMPGLGAGEVEHLIDQGKKVPGTFEHVRQGFGVPFFKRAEFHQLSEAQDGVERSA